MKVERFGQALRSEFRSIGIYVAAIGFFTAGYLFHMHGSAEARYMTYLLAMYRTPITLAVLGLPALLILNSVTNRFLELRRNRTQAIEIAEKNIVQQHAQIEHENKQLIARQSALKTLNENLRRKQHEFIERERKLNEAETRLRESATIYNAWADKVAAKVRKTSASLVGDASAQAPEQIEILQNGAEELLALLNKNPENVHEKCPQTESR
ncbi:MAG: hypothetical protein KQH59_06485 [Desulfobulbaceae bacterium]|nr:hypothetical protein [Desulfobulbaceae bacterium]